MSLDAAIREDLKQRQLAFFTSRLVSPAAKNEWRANVRAAFKAVLATPVGELVDRAAVKAALDGVTREEVKRQITQPAGTAAFAIAEARMRESGRTLGDWVPAEIRDKLDRLVGMPGVLPEAAIREALENDAAEAVMRDVLYDALREFSDKVNPFFAEWGVPGLFKALSPFGLGGMKKGFESLRTEFDKRLDPEIRKFLQGFSRRALKNVADVTIAKADEPGFIEIRRRLLGWVLARPEAELAGAPGDARVALAREIALDLTAHVAQSETMRAERDRTLDLWLSLHAKQPLSVALAGYGIQVDEDTVDLDALADASWPVLASVLGSDPIRRWFETIISEFFDSLA